MRILVFGTTGMLGHKLAEVLSKKHIVYATLRSRSSACRRHPVLSKFRLVDSVSVENFDSVIRAMAEASPEVVINCIGIVKQTAAARDALTSILVNALFPHRLAQVCKMVGCRLIHISTDCVFSGRKGNYSESDLADAEDLYGKTKFLGEVKDDGCLTLRTSMIGRELATSYGLLEWFLSQQGKTVRGYKRAIFSGFTTYALSEIIAQIIAKHPDMQGVWHVASEPISKFDLLSLVKQVYGLDIQIEPDEAIAIDRSLNAERFQQVTRFVPPSWPQLVKQMYQDPTPYSELRGSYALQ